MRHVSVEFTIRYKAWLGCASAPCVICTATGVGVAGADRDRCRATASRTSDRNS
jgi:hypothetical protein